MQVIPFPRIAKPLRRIFQLMLLDKHRDRPLFRSLNPICVAPTNSDSKSPVATAFNAEVMGSQEVIQSRGTTCLMLSCPPILHPLKSESVAKKSLG